MPHGQPPEGAETAPEGTEEDQPTTTTETDAAKLAAEVERWKAHARKHEAQAKANAEAAKKLAELEEADKTELQKLTDRLTAAQAEIQTLQGELVRERVARRHNLTDEQAKRLIGETEEELEADAAELVKMLAPPEAEEDDDDDGGLPGAPRPRLKSGSKRATALNDDKMLADLKRKVGAR